jgi:hypothetical protein
MGRPKGSKNRKTLIREAHMAQVNDLKEHEIVDSIHVLEASMRHFFYRALRGESIGRKEAEIDEDYRQAGTLAGMLAPYKHPRLGAIKVAGDVNKQIGLGDDASLEELRAAVLMHLERLAPVLRIEGLVPPSGGIANRDVTQDGAGE